MPDSVAPKRTLCLMRCPCCGMKMQLVVVEGKQGEQDVSWEGRICPRCHHGLPKDLQVTRVRMIEQGR